MTSTEDSSPDITWQEAVARLAKERTLAESCAGLLKKVGDAAAVARGALAYADAKAEYDGIIAGLTVALAQKADPTSLPELQAMLAQGFAKRQAFCESVKALAPGPVAGQKGVVEDIVKGVIGPVIDAVKAIWLRTRDDSALTRKLIETQLEATAWQDFAAVVPGP